MTEMELTSKQQDRNQVQKGKMSVHGKFYPNEQIRELQEVAGIADQAKKIAGEIYILRESTVVARQTASNGLIDIVLKKFGGALGINIKAQNGDKIRSNLINQEAEIGGSLLGREEVKPWRRFFCLDDEVWIWHEWIPGQEKPTTTRYEIHGSEIIVAQDSQRHRAIDIGEARNLRDATAAYWQAVSEQVYNQTPVQPDSQPDYDLAA